MRSRPDWRERWPLSVRKSLRSGLIGGLALVLLVTAVCCVAPLPLVAAATDDSLTVTSVAITPGDTAVCYKDYDDTYLIGPGGYVEWKITVAERVVAGPSTAYLAFDDDGYELIGDNIEFSHKVAKFSRQEGEHTLVFRFAAGPGCSSGYVALQRNMRIYSGVFNYLSGPAGSETTKRAFRFDFSSVTSMSKFYFRNEWPSLTVSPSPAALMVNGESVGLTADLLVADIYDAVLDPADFEIRYDLINEDTREVHTVEWQTCSERNYIPIPESFRRRNVQLWVEIRDCVGNERPFNYVYASKAATANCLMTTNSLMVLGGEGLWGYVYENPEFPMSPEEKNMMYSMARQDFLTNVKTQYDAGAYSGFATVAVFIYNPGMAGAYGYSNSRDNIDIEKCGFQWSKEPYNYDPTQPFMKFNQREGDDNIYPGTEYLASRQRYVEGYWCVIRSDADNGIREDGTYYLQIGIADKVSGGHKSSFVLYTTGAADPNGPGNSIIASPVKFMRDTNSPEVTLSAPEIGTSGNDEITLDFRDFGGVYQAQYTISRDTGNILDSNLWLNGPWKTIDIPDNSTAFSVKLNVNDLNSQFSQFPRGLQPFYLHVRARDKRTEFYGDGIWRYYGTYGLYGDLITTQSQRYVATTLTNTGVQLNAGYFGRVDGAGELQAAAEQQIRLYGSAAYDSNPLHNSEPDAPGDVYYRVETLSGDPAGGDEYARLATNPLVLTGLTGKYRVHAYVGGDSWPIPGGNGNKYNEVSLDLELDKAAPPEVLCASLSTYEYTNQDVIVTITAATPVKLNGAGDYKTTHSLIYSQNGLYDVAYETQDGQTGVYRLTIANIDKQGFAPAGAIFYSTTGQTDGNVTAYLHVGKPVRQDGDGASYQDGWVSYTFTENGSHTFDVTDLAGNRLAAARSTAITAEVSWIDRTTPLCTIGYTTREQTNQPVVATISVPAGFRVISNGGKRDRTFYDNGSFVFVVRDAAGHDYQFPATVNNIDLTPPVITLQGKLTHPIYQGMAFEFEEPGYQAYDDQDGNITSRVTVNSQVNAYQGGYYEVVYQVSDSAGNTAREVRGVTVYDSHGINLMINGTRVRGGEELPKGNLSLSFVGLQSDSYTLAYLPGKCKLGSFKSGGAPILANQVTIDTEGWYTFFVQDQERNTYIAAAYLK